MELPKYKCHKEVRAAKIETVMGLKYGAAMLYFADLPEIRVSREYYEKHRPVPGGYFVVYDEGYQSFSPAKAFEDGYTRIEG
jgi:hypothetical protein